MNERRAFALVFGCTALCGTVGCLLGYALGVLAPGYYRAVFEGGYDPGFDPVQVGPGLGLTQGLGAGLVVGVIVVLAAAWPRSRREGADPTRSDGPAVQAADLTRNRRTRRALGWMAVLLAVLVAAWYAVLFPFGQALSEFHYTDRVRIFLSERFKTDEKWPSSLYGFEESLRKGGTRDRSYLDIHRSAKPRLTVLHMDGNAFVGELDFRWLPPHVWKIEIDLDRNTRKSERL
jgi:hypothetical protein